MKAEDFTDSPQVMDLCNRLARQGWKLAEPRLSFEMSNGSKCSVGKDADLVMGWVGEFKQRSLDMIQEEVDLAERDAAQEAREQCAQLADAIVKLSEGRNESAKLLAETFRTLNELPEDQHAAVREIFNRALNK
jgi:hypothetical protein